MRAAQLRVRRLDPRAPRSPSTGVAGRSCAAIGHLEVPRRDARPRGHANPRPGSEGTRIAPRTARRRSPRLGEQVERRQAVGRQRPAGGQAGGGVHGGGDPDRAVEASRRGRRRSRRREPARRRAGRPEMPPQRAIFRHTASVAPEPAAPSSAAVSSIASGTSTSARTARSASTPWTGSSASSIPAGASERRAATASSTLPGAVGVDADRHARPDRRPHGGEAARVVADPDLDLDRVEVRLRRGGSGGRRRPRGPRRRSSR